MKANISTKTILSLIGLCFMVAIIVGCVTNSPPPKDFDFGKFPSDYQNTVTNYVQQKLDVYGDVYYKDWIAPYKGSILLPLYRHQYGWAVQVLISCKISQFGGYGNYEFTFILKDDEVVGKYCYAPDMATFSYPTVKKSGTN